MRSTLLGCALVLALAACTAGIQLTERGAGVQHVTQAQMPGGCRLVGDVAIGLPPDAARPRTEEQLSILMRNKAGEMGANHVLLETSEQRTEAGAMHWVGRGIAYHCDANAEPPPPPPEGTTGGEAPLDPELAGE